MPWLVGPLNWDINVVRLLLAELRNHPAKSLHHIASDFFIELLRQNLDGKCRSLLVSR